MIIQIRRLEDGTRRVTEIAEITGMEGDTIAIATMFHLEREGRDPRGFFKCRHVGSGLPPKFLEQLEQEAVPFKLEWLRLIQLGFSRQVFAAPAAFSQSRSK